MRLGIMIVLDYLNPFRIISPSQSTDVCVLTQIY